MSNDCVETFKRVNKNEFKRIKTFEKMNNLNRKEKEALKYYGLTDP